MTPPQTAELLNIAEHTFSSPLAFQRSASQRSAELLNAFRLVESPVVHADTFPPYTPPPFSSSALLSLTPLNPLQTLTSYLQKSAEHHVQQMFSNVQHFP
jgi:hypothetical protein